LRGAPLPSADPRLETGALKLDSPFYVRRPADEAIERLVRQHGETILVNGPRQVGKTSLAARAQAAAQANGDFLPGYPAVIIPTAIGCVFGGMTKSFAPMWFKTKTKPWPGAYCLPPVGLEPR
jgi:hypothetical protein